MITESGTFDELKHCVLTQIYCHVYNCGHVDIFALVDGKTCMFAHYRQSCDRCNKVRVYPYKNRQMEARALMPYSSIYQYHPQWHA